MQRYILLHANTRCYVTVSFEEESMILNHKGCRWILAVAGIVIAVLFSIRVFAQGRIVNIYGWSNEVPAEAIRQFENETGIKVNFSTYENNEVMYSKLRATKSAGYDIIMPSSYFVDRMRRQKMLAVIDKTKLTNWKNVSKDLANPAYDPNSQYSMPLIWGITGMFINTKYFPANSLSKWTDLWDNKFNNQLLMLDDTREMFSMALLSLGYSANDQDPAHIKQAFDRLKALMPNIKVFASDAVASILIDEDATVGMAWNGDTFKSTQENPSVTFVFPKEGYVIWVDTFAIPINAPHKAEAYAFLNFMLRAEIAKQVAYYTNFAIANDAGRKLLPPEIRNNKTVYPPADVLKHGEFQTDLRDDTLELYEQYWEQLKMGAN